MVSSNGSSSNGFSSSLGDSLLVKSILDTAALDSSQGALGVSQALNAKAPAMTSFESQLQSSTLGNANAAQLSSGSSTSSSQGIRLGNTSMTVFSPNRANQMPFSAMPAGVDPLTGKLKASTNRGTLAQSTQDIIPDTNLPDLVTQFGKVSLLTNKNGNGKTGPVQVVVTNQGNQRAKGQVDITLYASTDPFLDANDVQLTILKKQALDLNVGQSQTYAANVNLPQNVADNGYYLIADVNPHNTIKEIGKGNNLAVYNTADSPSNLLTLRTAIATNARQGTNTTLQKTVLWNNPVTGENLLWYTDDPTWLKGGNTSDQVLGVYESLPTQTTGWTFQTTLDLDGDKQSDILWRNIQTGAIQAWLMDGTTKIQTVDLSASVAGTTWQVQGGGDFDGEKVDPNGVPVPPRDEIVWRNYSTGETVIWVLKLNTTTGKYDIKPGGSGVAYFQTIDPSWKLQGIGDFNDDQKPDFMWRNAVSGDNAIWLLNGVSSNSDGSLSSNPLLGAGYFPTLTDQNWQLRGASDFNEDGKSDVIWQNATTGENATWYMDGTNVLASATNYSWFPRAVENTPWRSYAPYKFYETNPVVSAGLANDTAITGTNTDLMTSDPTISGQVTGDRTTSVLKARLGTTQAFTTITTTLPANGQFTLSRAQLQQLNGGTPLADGTYTLDLQAQDVHLNLSSITSLTFTLDTQAPTISSTATLAPESDTGRSTSDLVTNQKTLSLTGTATADATIRVFDGAQNVGQATASSTGTWQVPTSILADGTHSLTAKAFDTAGNASAATTELTVTIDTQVAAPTALKLTPVSDTGSSSTDKITNQTRPTFTGVAEAQAEVTLREGTTVLGSAIADNAGVWQIPLTTALTTGDHSLTATAIDVAGNTSVASTLLIQVDTLAPTLTLTTDLTNATLDAMSRLAGTLSDLDSGVASLKYRFGTGTDIPVSVGTDGKFDQALSFNGAPIGSTTLTITGTDVAGNAVSTIYSVTTPADTQAPTISASFDSSNIDQPKIVARVTDDQGVQSLQARFSNQAQFSPITVDAATGNYLIDLKQLNGGQALSPVTAYTVYLQAKDTSNNVSTPQSVQVYFADPTKPISISIPNLDGSALSGRLELPAPDSLNGPKDSTTNQPYTGPVFIQQTPEGEVEINIGTAFCETFRYIPPVPPLNPSNSSRNRPAGRYDYKLYLLGGSGTDPVAIGGGNFNGNQLTINQIPGGGGLRSGSYLLVPDYVPVKPLSEIDANPDENCVACRSRKQFNADASVELHSGAVLKSHDLLSYQSKDQTHSWGLSYNSLRADARPIVHFGYDDIGTNIKDNYRMTGLLKVKTSGTDVVSEGYTTDLGISGAKVGENYWKLPAQGGGLQGALQVDMRGQASGVYDYSLETGIKVLCDCENLVGDSTTLRDKLVVVNGFDSDFGTGWGLAGLQKIYETTTQDASSGRLEYNALVVDGDGSYVVFRSQDGTYYASASGEFSVLSKQNGRFSRTTKDGTVYAFNADNKLISTTDRNGQKTQVVYDADTKRLVKIVDSANLETTFTYGATGKIETIKDPANRITQLTYESYVLNLNGQPQTQYRLKSIKDPDTYTRSFGYTAATALLTSDQDKRAKTSTIIYDDLTGRAKQAIDKDTQIVTTVSPAQIQGVRAVDQTKNPLGTALPTAATPELGKDPFSNKMDQLAFANYKDGAQNAAQQTGDSKIYLDRSQEETYTKDEFGNSDLIERNNGSPQGRYLPSKVTDARGQQVSYSYDSNGNVIQVSDPLANNIPAPGAFFPDANLSFFGGSVAVDWDGDGKVDLISKFGDTISYGDGKGLFSAPVELADSGRSLIAVGDLNQDGHPDLVTTEYNYSGTSKIRIFLSDPTDHTLRTPQEFLVPQGEYISQQGETIRISQPTHLVLADLNGDNAPEIVAMGLGYDNEKWQMALQNNGGDDAGVFQDPTNGATLNPLALLKDDYGNNREYSPVVVGDINGDDRQDVVLVASRDVGAGGSTPKIYTLLGQSNNGFAVGTSLETTSLTGTTVALGHFSSLTTNDLLIGYDNTLKIFAGDGQGNFGAQTTQELDGTGHFFKDSIRDINGDGKLDVVTRTTSAIGNQFLIRYGTGSGSLGSSQTYSTGSNTASPFAWGDLDGNGQIDLLLRTPNAISSLQQQADHSFVAQSNASAPAVSSTTLSFGVDITPIQTIVGDVSGDWVPDLIALTSTGLSVRMGYGDGTYADPLAVTLSGSNQAIAAGDLDGDGSQDIVVANSSGTLTTVMSDGKGKFLNSQSLLVAVGGNPTALALQDLNGDGKLDIVSTNAASNTVSVLFGTGTGNFITAGEPYAVGTNPKAMAIGDVDGDGKLDIAVANAGSNSVSVLMNTGSGIFSPQTIYSLTSTSPTAIAIGDIDGDGTGDLVVGTNNTTDNLWVFKGQAGALPQVTATQKYTFGNQPVTALAIADMDGDGKLDVVTTHTYGTTYVQLGGTATLLAKQRYQFNGSPNTGMLALTDADLDGAIDILTTEQKNGATSAVVRLNDRLRIALPNALGKRVTEYDTKFDPTTGQFIGTYANRFNQVTREIDELGRQTIYQLDNTTGNVLRMIQVVGAIDSATQLTNRMGDDLVTDYTYTADGRVLEVHNSLKHVTRYDYTIDAKNVGAQLRRVTSAYGTLDAATEAYEYDAAGNRTASIDEYGNRTTYTYKTGTNLLETMTAADPDGTGPLTAAVTSYLYDENGNEIQTTGPDPDGEGSRLAAVMMSQYDAMNRLVSTTAPDPDGEGSLQAAVTTYEYDLNGNQTATVDALGRRTESVYDSRNRLVASVRKDALGTLLTQSGSLYDVTNNATGMIDANGNRTNTVYDKRGRRIREIDALGNITRFIYDAANQLAAQVDAKGNMTRYVYDELGRQIKVIDANGNATQTVYDKNGNVIAQIDANGNRTESRYDNRDRTVRTYDANNTSGTEASRKFTEMTYGRVTIAGKDYAQTQIIDPNVNATTYVYDGLGRLSTDTNQLGKTWSYNYDAVGNQIQMSDRNGLTRTFEYDNLSRQTRENWMSAGTVTRSFTSQYDVLDRLVNVTDNSIAGGITTKLSEYGYRYDDFDRVRTIDNLEVGGVARVLLTYDYDAEGNIKSVTDTINGTAAGTTAYDYDALNRATQITQSGVGITNKRVKLSYNALSQMETLQRLTEATFNQTVATTTYAYNDSLNRLTQISHASATGGTISSYAFNYDNGSRINKIVNADGTFVDYDYANNDELAAADYTNRTDEAYTYDANGNRTNLGYVTGTNNQLSSDGKYTYTYDDEGNLKTRTDLATSATRTFNWDYRNRLTSVVENSVTLGSYAYDANNQRIAKTTGGVTTRYVYDRGNVALEFNGTGATPSVRYLYGTQVDQILAQDKGGGNVSWQLTDQLGSVRTLVGNNGAVRNQFEYDAFGKVVSTMTGATDDSRYRYTGREFDGETGLYYYRARYYDAGVGRFIGQDPIGFEAGDGNLYRYVGNEPTNTTDPSGNVKIELVFNPLPFIGGFNNIATYNFSTNHAFIRVTDKNCPGGVPSFYRGGPTNEFGSPESFKLNFGSIITKHGQYTTTSKDYQAPATQATKVVYDNPNKRWGDFHDKLERSLRLTEQSNIKYKLEGPNSNSVAYQALKDVGINNIALPNGVAAPGWGVNLRDSKLQRWFPPRPTPPVHNVSEGWGVLMRRR